VADRPGRYTLAERLARKTDRSGGPDACWPFTGCISVNRGSGLGYGQLRVGSKVDGTRRLVKAHRLALILKTGEDRPLEDACHSCDNTVCCNPAHLSWGTHRANMADYIAKYGRIAVSKRPLPPRPGLPFEAPTPTDAELIAAACDAAMAEFDD
jgi:hypothetical protein